MDNVMVIVWGAILIVSIIVEALTVQLVSLWFAVASILSMLLAYLGTPIWVQTCVFIAVTVILIIVTKPLVKKLQRKPARTNADINIGKTAIVTEEINNQSGTGRATISGVSWMARSLDGNVIPKDSIVKIVDIDSAKLIVTI